MPDQTEADLRAVAEALRNTASLRVRSLDFTPVEVAPKTVLALLDTITDLRADANRESDNADRQQRRAITAERRAEAAEQRVADLTEERDYFHAGRDVLRERLRGTVTLRGKEPNYWAEWHVTHCAAAQGAANERACAEAAEADATALRDRVKAALDHTGGEVSCAGYSVRDDGCFVADLAARVEAALDGAPSPTTDAEEATE